jgi:hypothetical protein
VRFFYSDPVNEMTEIDLKDKSVSSGMYQGIECTFIGGYR